MNGQVGEVRKCTNSECPLYAHRGVKDSEKKVLFEDKKVLGYRTTNCSNSLEKSSCFLGGNKLRNKICERADTNVVYEL
ncbi:MAG: hypothetical protein HQ557_15475 [Bacteroidetes bacterium]|nr:hypothetical protein [Bacteroidota bacterium]